jgi:hypothetical protein
LRFIEPSVSALDVGNGCRSVLVVQFVFGQFLGCALVGYFAVSSAINARVSIANREEALVGLESQEQRDTLHFLRLWLAMNVASSILLSVAAVLVWVDWHIAVILAVVPVVIFAIANVMTDRRTANEDS